MNGELEKKNDEIIEDVYNYYNVLMSEDRVKEEN